MYSIPQKVEYPCLGRAIGAASVHDYVVLFYKLSHGVVVYAGPNAINKLGGWSDSWNEELFALLPDDAKIVLTP